MESGSGKGRRGSIAAVELRVEWAFLHGGTSRATANPKTDERPVLGLLLRVAQLPCGATHSLPCPHPLAPATSQPEPLLLPPLLRNHPGLQ